MAGNSKIRLWRATYFREYNVLIGGVPLVLLTVPRMWTNRTLLQNTSPLEEAPETDSSGEVFSLPVRALWLSG